MATEVIIRRAREGDVPDLTRIYNYAILNTTATFDMEPKTLDERMTWFHSHSDKYPLIVAEIEGKVVGWGSIHPYGERRAYRFTVENAIYIDCDYQGKGIGTSILDELIRLVDNTGYHAIIALIVAGNDASVHLHLKFGFELVGIMKEVGRKFDRWLDLLVLEKILSNSDE